MTERCRPVATLLAWVVLLLLPPAPVLAWQAPRATQPDVSFSHRDDDGTHQPRVRRKHGEVIWVRIIDTADACFEYPVAAIKLEAATPRIQAGDTGQATVLLPINHSEENGGYHVDVKRKAEAPAACAQLDLPERRYTIRVDTDRIEVAFAGGFSFSSLTDPVFAARQVQVQTTDAMGQEQTTTQSVVVRDTNAEDATRLGIGSFIHVYGRYWPAGIPAITFGLGLAESGGPTYFIGPFWRLGRDAFLGGGLAFGSVKRLPAGVFEGDVVTDQNLFANLGTRTDRKLFFGITYSFLGNRGDLEKPFKAVREAGGSGAAAPAPAAADPEPDPGNTVACGPGNGSIEPAGDAEGVLAVDGNQVTIAGKVGGCTWADQQLRVSVRLDGADAEPEEQTVKIDDDGRFEASFELEPHDREYIVNLFLPAEAADPMAEDRFRVEGPAPGEPEAGGCAIGVVPGNGARMPAGEVSLRFTATGCDLAGAKLTLAVHDAEGKAVTTAAFSPPDDGKREWRVSLDAGTYEVHATLDDADGISLATLPETEIVVTGQRP